MRLPEAELDHILEYAGKDLRALQGARLFVTGGTGFIGRWFLAAIEHANERLGLGITASVLTRQSLPPGCGITYLQGDVCNYAYPDGTYTHFIHGATEASAAMIADEPALMFDTIVTGTRRTLEHAVLSGKVPFLFLSSGAVYGPQPHWLTHVPETFRGAPDPTVPASCYGEGKRAAEQLCALFHSGYGLQCKISRCFAFAGPLLAIDSHFAIGNFVRDKLKGGPISIGGDGTPRRSYLHPADLTVWLLRILVQGRAMQAYNTGSNQAYSIREIADAVAAQETPVVQAKQPEPGAVASWYVPDTSLANQELDLHEHFTLDAMIRSMIEWNTKERSR